MEIGADAGGRDEDCIKTARGAGGGDPRETFVHFDPNGVGPQPPAEKPRGRRGAGEQQFIVERRRPAGRFAIFARDLLLGHFGKWTELSIFARAAVEWITACAMMNFRKIDAAATPPLAWGVVLDSTGERQVQHDPE